MIKVNYRQVQSTCFFSINNSFLSKSDKKLLTNGNLCDKIQITKNDKCVRKGRYYEKTKLFCNDNLNTCKGGIRAYNRMLYICTSVRVYDNGIIALTGRSVYLPMIITLYLAAAVALVIVTALDRLLSNIRHDKVFIPANVKILRLISYCCFAVSVIFIYFSFIRPFAWLVVIAAAFFGLILRVIKNVFEQAIILKEENDFTI